MLQLIGFDDHTTYNAGKKKARNKPGCIGGVLGCLDIPEKISEYYCGYADFYQF
jgi:hypothetical protein